MWFKCRGTSSYFLCPLSHASGTAKACLLLNCHSLWTSALSQLEPNLFHFDVQGLNLQ